MDTATSLTTRESVERRMRGDTHVRCGERAGETGREKSWNRAPVRLSIMGAGRGSAIGTLVERTTRFVLLLHLAGGHSPQQTATAMIYQMSRLPQHLRRSVTWDQGTEMGAHTRISMALDMPIYFCDPHSPWQRGSNENTNGLLRQYFPKGTDLSVHSADYLDFVATELNERPRATLEWQTPMQQMNALLLR